MSPTTKTATATTATLDDLYRFEGKAELIGGRIVPFMPSGDAPSEIAFEIAVRLRDYARQQGVGVAYPDGVGYALDPPLPNGRQSFSPDASYYSGPRPRNRMRFIGGPPTFAVEVRSENDYGPAAEAEMAAKRDDYFAAGTLTVWDVDPLAKTIVAHRADSPAFRLASRKARSPTRGPRCRAGECRWTRSFPEPIRAGLSSGVRCRVPGRNHEIAINRWRHHGLRRNGFDRNISFCTRLRGHRAGRGGGHRRPRGSRWRRAG